MYSAFMAVILLATGIFLLKTSEEVFNLTGYKWLKNSMNIVGAVTIAFDIVIHMIYGFSI